MELPFNFVKALFGKLNETTPGTFLNVTDFTEYEKPLNKTGLALYSLIADINYFVNGTNESTIEIPYNFVLQESVFIMSVILTVSMVSLQSIFCLSCASELQIISRPRIAPKYADIRIH